MALAARANACEEDHARACSLLEAALNVSRGPKGYWRYVMLLDLASHLELAEAPPRRILDAVEHRAGNG